MAAKPGPPVPERRFWSPQKATGGGSGKRGGKDGPVRAGGKGSRGEETSGPAAEAVAGLKET